MIASVCWGAVCSNHYLDPATGLASKRTVLTAETLESLTIHSLSLHDATYQRSPAARTSASILLVKVQFRHFETYCRAEWGATRENREETCVPSPPHPSHCPKGFKQWSAPLGSSWILKSINSSLVNCLEGLGFFVFFFVFYYTVYLFWSKLDVFWKII